MRVAWQRFTRITTKLKTAMFTTALVATSLVPMLSHPSIAHADDSSSCTITLSGSSWLSGGGVNVCSGGDESHNCVAVAGAPGQSQCNNTAGQVWSGDEWECVEMVNRLYLAQGWTDATWFGNGNTLVNSVPAGLTKQDNGHISYVNPGDVITLDDGGFGHAAIVNSGTTTVNIINQNASLNSSASINTGTLGAGTAHYNMSGWAGYSVQAFIHHPGTVSSGTLWGINTSGQAVRYAGSGVWTYQGGVTFQDIANDSDGSTVAAVSTAGGVYTYIGNGTWHQVSGQTLTDIADQDGTLWGINTSGQAMRYAGSGVWTYQGGVTFTDIAASGIHVAAVSTAGGVYTYTGNGTWHQVSGATLTDVADQDGTLWGVNTSGQAVRYAGSGVWTYQGGVTFTEIGANASTVVAVSTTGGVYTYIGNGTWHQVSGATLTDATVQ